VFSPRLICRDVIKPFYGRNARRPPKVTMMLSEKLATLRTHRNRIFRYRRLLKTQLTELERDYIERRLSEERCALEALAGSTFPLVLKAPNPPAQKPPVAA
jgi:hypothetical protein